MRRRTMLRLPAFTCHSGIMRAVIARLRRTLQRLRSQPPLRRELLLLTVALLFSLLVLPLLIWVAGRLFLGEYLRDPSGASTGGPWALLADYLTGIVALSPGHWLVLLGPYVLTVAFRAGGRLLKM
jgi:hypothetical protein